MTAKPTKFHRIVPYLVLVTPASYPLLAIVSAAFRREAPPLNPTMVGVLAGLLTYFTWSIGIKVAYPTVALIFVTMVIGFVSNLVAFQFDSNHKKYRP